MSNVMLNKERLLNFFSGPCIGIMSKLPLGLGTLVKSRSGSVCVGGFGTDGSPGSLTG